MSTKYDFQAFYQTSKNHQTLIRVRTGHGKPFSRPGKSCHGKLKLCLVD